MKFIIIEKKDSDRYVIYDSENKGMCCASKYTLMQLRDNGHKVVGLNSTKGTVKVGDITIMTLDEKPREKAFSYDVSDVKRSTVTIEKGIKPTKDDSKFAYEVLAKHTAWNKSYKKLVIKVKEGYFTDAGQILSKDYEIVSKKRVDNPKVYKVLLKAYNAYLEYEAIKEKIAALSSQSSKCSFVLNHIKDELTKANGLLTRSEFIKEFSDNLSESVKDSIKRYGFSFEPACMLGYSDTIFHLSYSKDIQKWFRNGSFVYEEYDGTIHMDSNCEDNEEYKQYIKQYSNVIPCLKAKPEEYLTLGDKDWLSYNCAYVVKAKKPMTKAYAKELAKEFCA